MKTLRGTARAIRRNSASPFAPLGHVWGSGEDEGICICCQLDLAEWKSFNGPSKRPPTCDELQPLAHARREQERSYTARTFGITLDELGWMEAVCNAPTPATPA